MIDQYATGSHMTVKGKKYYQDLKIIRAEVKANWWRQQGHRLDTGDIQDILSAQPKILVIGTGYAGNMSVPSAVRQTIEGQHIKVIAQTTAEAAKFLIGWLPRGRTWPGHFTSHARTDLKNASKCPGLRCPAQVEILTYSVYAPFSIHGTPCPEL
jgi:hypothetical protein